MADITKHRISPSENFRKILASIASTSVGDLVGHASFRKRLWRIIGRHRLRLETITIAGRSCPWLCIAEPELALQQAIFCQTEEADPFWATNWASSFALADWMSQNHSVMQNLNVLELGCGSGISGIAAGQCGADICLSDVSGDALLLASLNAQLQRQCVRTLRLDWHIRRSDIREYDAIIAADVLYDRTHFGPVVSCLRRYLKADGVAYFSEPYRSSGDAFIQFAIGQGVSVQQREISSDPRVRLLICTIH